MRALLASTILLASAATAAPRHHAKTAAQAPDLLTASTRVIAGRDKPAARSPYLLSALDEPDTDQPEGVQLRWKLTKVKLRVPIG